MALKMKAARDTAPLQVTSTSSARAAAQRVEPVGDKEIVRGMVCQLSAEKVVPGYDVGVSLVPYFAESNSGEFNPTPAVDDEYKGMHDDAVVTLLMSSAPITFLLTDINFGDDVAAEDFNVDDYLVPFAGIEAGAVSYPATVELGAGRVMAAPAAGDVADGTSVPVIGQVIKVNADSIEVRPLDGSRAIVGTFVA